LASLADALDLSDGDRAGLVDQTGAILRVRTGW
jgi:hypothetical protein